MATRSGQSEIRGGRELAALLDAMPRKLSKTLLIRALRRAAADLRREARARAPKRAGGGPLGKTGRTPGNLRRAIRLRTRSGRGDAAPGLQVYVAGAGFYGRFVEYGTSRMAARPFLRPAFDARVNGMVAQIAADLGREVEQAAVELTRQLGTR